MKKIVVPAVLVVVVVLVGLFVWKPWKNTSEETAASNTAQTGATASDAAGDNTAGKQPAATASNETTSKPPKETAKKTPSKPADKSAKKPAQPASSVLAYCKKAANDTVRAADTKALAQQGGLVAIFQKEAALNGKAYACADKYLAHGGKIDAVDPRSDSEHLTPLLFALQRNDSRMVGYVIDHGADLRKRGGPDDTRPYGYAVYLALKNRATNYNGVIEQLDKALRKQPASK